MSQVEWAGPASTARSSGREYQPANLADLLERILDKGIVIVGDIRVNLLDIELLTIKIRLLVASVDRAKEMGIDWWEHDPAISSKARREAERAREDMLEENRRLRERLADLEAQVASPPVLEGEPVEAPAARKSTQRRSSTQRKSTAQDKSTAERRTTAQRKGTEATGGSAADEGAEREDADE